MLSVGSRLGRYQIERSLGQGGTGTVFLAYDPTLERRVAIKLLENEREGPPNVPGSCARRERHPR
jgi:eukaryotic-like serine/threonine-protein kinase